jgi:hypothetical protein
MRGAALILIACIAAISTCKRGRPDPDKPPVELMQWGTKRADTEKLLAKQGWQIQEWADFLRAGIPPEGDARPDPDELPFQMTFYFQNDRLNIVQIQIRNNPERTAIFEKNLREAFKLQAPVHNRDMPERVTEAGNRIKENHSLYDAGETFIKIYKSQVQVAEARVEDVADELDVMIYSKKENEGISAEGLLVPEDA